MQLDTFVFLIFATAFTTWQGTATFVGTSAMFVGPSILVATLSDVAFSFVGVVVASMLNVTYDFVQGKLFLPLFDRSSPYISIQLKAG